MPAVYFFTIIFKKLYDEKREKASKTEQLRAKQRLSIISSAFT